MLSRLLHHKNVRQLISLYASMLLGTGFGLAVSILNTRLLGPEWYGDLKFLFHLFTFTSTIMTFGLFVTGCKLVAQRENEPIRGQLVGGMLTVSSLVSLCVIAGLFIFSFYVDDLFHHGLGEMIRIFSPLLFVFPYKMCLENILQGDNRIFHLACFRISPTVLYLFGAVLFNYYTPLSLSSSLAIHLGASTLLIAGMWFLLKPDLKRGGQTLPVIFRDVKEYGFHVYLGTIANVATASGLALYIGYIIDKTTVGYYTLALTVAMPLTFIPRAFGTTLFKTFANRDAIPAKAIIAAASLSIFTLLFFLILIDDVIVLFYTEKFAPAIPLAYIIGIGSLFHGFGDFFNRFLGAHGKGKKLRNGAFLVGTVNVGGGILLITTHGAPGAAVTNMAAGIVYCGIMYHYYRQYRKKLRFYKP